MTKHTDTGRRTAVSLIEKIGLALCQNALGGKKCPCAETGKFQCANEYPGHQAQAALTAIMGEGDGVQQCDREAAADLYLDQIGDEDGFADRIRANTAQPGCDAWEQAFARHRSTAAAAERAGIVASLRDTPWPYRNDALADAIERGEV